MTTRSEATQAACPLDRRVRGETLHLHLRFEYFDAIASGNKPKEYRDAENGK